MSDEVPSLVLKAEVGGSLRKERVIEEQGEPSRLERTVTVSVGSAVLVAFQMLDADPIPEVLPSGSITELGLLGTSQGEVTTGEVLVFILPITTEVEVTDEDPVATTIRVT